MHGAGEYEVAPALTISRSRFAEGCRSRIQGAKRVFFVFVILGVEAEGLLRLAPMGVFEAGPV